ncbi:phosphonate C-P lyase system protein PhnH [Burkholderia cepacia]|uniref:phosphonate C-P lyase system protein PhnH n=1 Tax=Burkholderia cepacia TaxID=292 RepID=UPI002AB7942B|nr:phosphonate C-P lyase system protein PhnH [Burkholderia cepacia]
MSDILISPHFKDPVHDAQVAFRKLLDALSRPGRPVMLDGPASPPAPMRSALAAVALTLVDADSQIWLDSALDREHVHRYLHVHTNAPRTTDPAVATMALVADPMNMPPLTAFCAGLAAYPDRSSTVIIQVPALTGGPSVNLRGPGIEKQACIAPSGLPDWFWPAWAQNTARYPLGVDAFLVDERSVVGLPRTSKVDIG